MTDYNNEQLEKYKGVKGWLLFLSYVLILGNPSGIILHELFFFFTFFKKEPSSFFYIGVFLDVILIVLSIRAGIALLKIKPGAVKIAKNYLLFLAVLNVISAILTFPTKSVIPPEIRSLILIGIWYWYLNVSKRVKATYKE